LLPDPNKMFRQKSNSKIPRLAISPTLSNSEQSSEDINYTDNVQKRIRAMNCTKNLNLKSRQATTPKRTFTSKTENSQVKGSRLNPRKMTEKNFQPNTTSPIKPNREKETETKGLQKKLYRNIIKPLKQDEKLNEKEAAPNKNVSKKVTSAVSLALKCTEMVMKSQDKISIPKLLSNKVETDVLVSAQVEEQMTDSNPFEDDLVKKPTNTENSNTDTEYMQQEKCQEMPELNLERIIEYLSQNNIPLNLEHIALKNEASVEQITLIDSKLESPIGELRLEKMMNIEKAKEKEDEKENRKDTNDERALLDQVEGALDEIVAAADLILLAELDEFPDENLDIYIKNDKSKKITKENDSNKEDMDSIREFENIEDQIQVEEHVVKFDTDKQNITDLEKSKIESLDEKVNLIEIANDNQAINPLFLEQDTSAELRDSIVSDEEPLLPIYQQRKIFELDPILHAMFQTDDLKVSQNEIASNCLVPQKSPDFESMIRDSYDGIIDTHTDKDDGEEVFIQESIVIENSKTFDKQIITENFINNEKEIIFDMSHENIDLEASVDEIQIKPNQCTAEELEKLSTDTGSCYSYVIWFQSHNIGKGIKGMFQLVHFHRRFS